MNAFTGEDAAREAEELERVAGDARRRWFRARFGTATMFVAAVAAFAGAYAARPTRAGLECHHVEIKWENVPGRPPDGWTRCREVQIR